MKYLPFIFLLLLCCTAIEQPTPMECYCIETRASLTTGEIIDVNADHAFVFTSDMLSKWQNDEGITVKRDTTHDVVTISTRICIEAQTKTVK